MLHLWTCDCNDEKQGRSATAAILLQSLFLLPFINMEKFNFNDLMDCAIESGSCLQRYLQMCLKMHAA